MINDLVRRVRSVRARGLPPLPLLLAGAGLYLLGLAPAGAACVGLATGPSLAPGSNLSLTCQTSGGGLPTVNGGSSLVNAPQVPGSYFYGHGYGGPTTVLPGSPSPGYGFYDDYVFTINGAVANSVTSSINLGTLSLSDLQVRLYELGANTLPTLGVPAGPVYSAWVSAIAGPGYSGSLAVIPATILGPGTYVLEVRGNVNGANGGSYSGSLNLQPVPLPAAGWMLLFGLAGVLSAAARRRE